MQHRPQSHKRVLSLAVSAALGVGSINAFAQAIEEETLEAAAASEISEDNKVVEEVMVTGSRIIRDGYSSASPMDVITVDSADVQGIADIGTLLQTTTIASGSPQVTTATSSAFVQEGGIGTSTISLRGLGASRTLVLLNGRRIGPAGVRGQVSSFDLGLMPIVAVERIEILKDGASTMYGSDAVAGVVNVITRKDDGLSFDVYGAAPSRSGGEQNRLSLRWGTSSDRGHFSIMGDYNKRSELKKGDRSYFDCGEQYYFDPETGDRADAIDPRTGNPHCNDLLWGHIWIYDYSGQPSGVKAQYDYDGDLGDYAEGFDEIGGDMVAPEGWYPVSYDEPSLGYTNADHPFQDGSSLIPDNETYTLYADASYNISDTLTMYAEVLSSRRETYVNGYRQFWTYIYNSNFDFGGGAGSDLSEGWEGSQWLSPTPITDHNDDSVEVSYGRALIGLEGQSGEYGWDISAQYSKSDGDYISDQIFNDSIRSSWFGSGSCEGALISDQFFSSSGRDEPCMDPRWLDPGFNAGELTPEERAFLFGREKGNTEYTQWSVEGLASGPLFEMPAGEVLGAIGFQFRGDEIKDVPGEITLASNAWGASAAGITEGTDNTRAVFAEVEMPLLTDSPFAELLMLNGSVRYTNVDSYGGDTTWKLGLNWEMTPTLRLRASSGTSFRTPALFELYLADQTSFIGQRNVDPCIGWGNALAEGNITQRTADNCAADGVADDFAGAAISATVITGGGLGVLEAETSTAQTLGLVWRPEFTDLSVSVDYFDIQIDDEVSQLGASVIVGQCYASEFFPNEALCDQFDRDPLDSKITDIRDSYINVATQKNRGWDLQATWATDMDMGRLVLETQHTFQIEDSVSLFAENTRDTNGDLGDPKWTGRASATLNTGDWSAAWVVNMVGEADNYRYASREATTFGRDIRLKLDTDRVMYHNASVAYNMSNGLTIRGGVRNVFDETPPRLSRSSAVSRQGNSAFYSQYDWEGRTFFANVRWEM
jgi:iron complex outermembrane receptor protein